LSNDVATTLIELIEVQTSAEDTRIGIREGAFGRANTLRALRKRWEDSEPHAAEWTKELRDRTQSAQVTIAKTVAQMKDNDAIRSERNQKLLASAKNLEQSQDRDPSPLMSEMLTAYRRELDVDLPPIIELFKDLDRQMFEIEEFLEACLRTESEGHSTKWFGRKNTE
jgi:hypothetical protein